MSDVGQNEPKKEIKRRVIAGLDKVGFIEAQALAWVYCSLDICKAFHGVRSGI